MIEIYFLTKADERQTRQILDVYHHMKWWPETVNDPERIHRIILGSHCFVLATKGGEVAGMGRALSDRTGDAYIHDLVVLEEYRGMGLGRMLVRKIIDRLVDDGITWVGLIAERNSHGFYERESFQTMADSTPMFKWVP